ncbi:MAG: hypothetical protein AAGA56_02815 [Myxococcota bacterium]
MKLGPPISDSLPWIRHVLDLQEARSIGAPGPRIEALRAAGRRLGDSLREGPQVVGVKTLNNVTLPYPTRFAFNGAVPLPWPFVTMVHRTLLVELLTEAGPKKLLFNPSDAAAARSTPFFTKLAERIESVAPFAEKLLSSKFESITDQLARLGIAPEDIDVIAFDHFHTQDLRPLLGTETAAARFPNAVLLAPRLEWNHWDGLHPMQRPWFIEDGKTGVPEERVILIDHDLCLGHGCLLVGTPGHTVGNQTLFVHSDDGVFGCSENGCSADNWSPRYSGIPGLKKFVDWYEVETVLNSNTPELGGEQYASMILERSVVDTVAERPEFVQMFPSSEVTPSPLAPGVQPAMLFGHRDGGRFAH